MKTLTFILSLFIFLKVSQVQAQGLQPGECGVRFTYDAAGNLTTREFICNNTGVVMYRTAKDEDSKNDSIKTGNNPDKIGEDDEIIKVAAIMPNPTSGRFMVRLSKSLNNGNVLLLDVNGKVMEKSRRSGNNLTFDISLQPSGTYFVKIESEGKVFTFRVIKQ